MAAGESMDRAQNIIARIERLPFTLWHVKMRLIVGTATFFDAFDAVTIAYILPVLIPLFELTPAQTGLLIAIGYVGQLVGALLFGWLAERVGRLPSLVASITIFSVMSVVCAFSWNYMSLFIFRALQGVGLGGEIPVAAAYVNELSKAKGRGRFVMLYELVFTIGALVCAILGFLIVPRFGWQYMFFIGALPALLALFMYRLVPESPRWLVNKGRLDQAEKIVVDLESVVSRNGEVGLPPIIPVEAKLGKNVTDWRELFRGIYKRRTLVIWTLWFCAYFIIYGLATWLPSLYTTVYKVQLQQALLYSLIGSLVGFIGTLICAFIIDRVGRKLWFVLAFAGSGICLVLLWLSGAEDPKMVLVLASLSSFFIVSIATALYLYTPEIYPTRLRALGSSIGTAWLRVASIIAPFLLGLIVGIYALKWAFLAFGLIALAASVISGLFTVETKGKVLEDISP
jgi:putative MFS transporter